MNAVTTMAPPTGLDLLRQPFPAHQISKLPKPYKKDSAKGKCQECGGYHGLPAAHLDYVGHAALTDRLLDADPEWLWEPLATTDIGLPAFDQTGGLWIKLTVCGVTRLGYGHAAAKSYGDPGMREKEVIGDALRNAAMRFGAALDLWHNGDLHLGDDAADSGTVGDNSEDRAVSSDGPADKPAKRGDAHSALKTALRGFVHEMEGCGDWDQWCAFRDMPASQKLIAEVREKLPEWWETGIGMPDEFVPLRRRIELLEANFANHIADVARV